MGPFLQVGGQWEIIQDNGFRVLIDVVQDGDRLSAQASHSAGSVRSRTATGFVRGPDFEMTIDWTDGTKGLYTGRLTAGPWAPAPGGYLKGETRDLNHPGSRSPWHTERAFGFR
jgi:hypothetical protein